MKKLEYKVLQNSLVKNKNIYILYINMKSRKNRNLRKKMRKTLKGGFFSNKNKYVVPLDECNPNNLTSLQTPEDLHANYQKCCPKGMFGRKNSSPYCKQVDLNFQQALKGENEANEYHGFQPDEVYQMKQQELESAPKKPWYKFWKGGKTKKHRKYRNKK